MLSEYNVHLHYQPVGLDNFRYCTTKYHQKLNPLQCLMWIEFGWNLVQMYDGILQNVLYLSIYLWQKSIKCALKSASKCTLYNICKCIQAASQNPKIFGELHSVRMQLRQFHDYICIKCHRKIKSKTANITFIFQTSVSRDKEKLKVDEVIKMYTNTLPELIYV